MARKETHKATVLDWIIDSGTLAHMSSQCKWFITYHPLVPPESVTIGNGESIPAISIGRVSINLKLGDNHTMTTVIRDIYYMPDLDRNLLSISYLAEFNLEVVFGRDSCRILDRNEVVGKGYKKN